MPSPPVNDSIADAEYRIAWCAAGIGVRATYAPVNLGNTRAVNAAAALALYTLYQFESLSPWNGLLQRSIILVVFLWIEIIAIRLMSLAGRPGARPGPAESPQAHGPWTA